MKRDIVGSPNLLPQQSGLAVDENVTLTRDITYVDVTGGTPTITLSSQPQIGDRVRVLANGGSATVSAGATPIVGGTTVPDGSSATFEFVEGSAWIATNAGGGGSGTGELLVANLTAVTALDDASLPSGVKAFPATIEQPFILDKTSTATIDAITVVATASGTGRWLRELLPAPRWTLQTTWNVDPATGNDENDGLASGTALATMAEVTRRLRLIDYSPYTINVLSDVASGDRFDFNPLFTGKGTVTSGNATISVIGQRTVTTTSALTAAALAVPASNTAASITDATVTWASQIGKLVVVTSGLQTGAIAWVLADIGGNSARLTNWYNPTTNVFSTAAPLAGSTYTLNDVTNFAAPLRNAGLVNRVLLSYSNLRLTGTVGFQDGGTTLTTCRLNSTVFGATAGDAVCRLRFNGCLFFFASISELSMFNTRPQFTGTGFLNVRLTVFNRARAEFVNATLQSSLLTCGANFGGADTSPVFGEVGIFTNTTNLGLGIFDTPSGYNAITLRRSGLMTADAPLYGTGAVGGSLFGCAISEGASLFVRSTVTPTITNTGGEVQLEGAGTAIPPLAGGAGVPAASALATWANWTAAPFSRFVMNYATGAKVCSVATVLT